MKQTIKRKERNKKIEDIRIFKLNKMDEESFQVSFEFKDALDEIHGEPFIHGV